MSVANVLTTTDSGFESGIGDWQYGNFTSIATSTVQAHSGSHSLAVTSLTGGVSSTYLAPNGYVPFLPGAIATPSCYAYPGAADSCYLQINWIGSDKATVVGTSTGPSLLLPGGQWSQVSFNGAPAPANTAWAELVIVFTGNNGGTINYVDDVAFSWANYATNMCPNPSFEAGISGWTTVTGDEILTQVNQNNNTVTATGFTQPQIATMSVLYGFSALEVETAGTAPLEGVQGPATWMPPTTAGSMSCYVFGETGTVAMSVVNQITGAILGSQPIVLNGLAWQQLQISNLTFLSGDPYYIQITTFGPAQHISFLVDGVMYQPEAPSSPYVDGDQFQCYWAGTVEGSASFQPYKFGIVATSSFVISGTANIIEQGETFPIAPDALEFYISGGPAPPGGVTMTVVNPGAAMTDFGIWLGGALGTDLDPAQTYATWNNQGTMTGTAAYIRSYMGFAPPLDFINSTGAYNWKRAAYLALGWQWINVTQGQTQIITDIQTEMIPVNAYTAITPRTYQKARQLQVKVRPDRLNYVTNPSFENQATTGWSEIGTGITLGISGNIPQNIGATYLNEYFGPGMFSMSVAVSTSSGTGVQISVPYLIPGRIYMASAWVYPDGGQIGDIVGSCASGTGDVLDATDELGYGTGQTFGGGPYGGVQATTVPLQQQWYQVSFSFTATADTHNLSFNPTNIVGATFPYTWLIDAVMVEDGDILNPYFDGNSGVDALWLDGGTPNLCQSFYYNQLQIARHIVTDSLNANTPLGISYATPLYAQMPSQ